jgi:hypothetical protein
MRPNDQFASLRTEAIAFHPFNGGEVEYGQTLDARG